MSYLIMPVQRLPRYVLLLTVRIGSLLDIAGMRLKLWFY